jgi:cytochrome c oxidase subunit 3
VALASLSGHDAVVARYSDVEPIYAETRDIRLLGFVFFLMSDVVLFSIFIFAYLYLRNSVPNWPPIVKGGLQLPRFDTAFAAVNSIVLFGSGVTMHLAMEAWRHANRSRFTAFIIATIVLGIGFLSGQAYEYTHLHDTWAGSTFGASFFTLTGMHGFHVFIGVIFLCTVLWQTRRGVYTTQRHFGLTAATLYWHFVDVIWVALFFLFYVY